MDELYDRLAAFDEDPSSVGFELRNDLASIIIQEVSARGWQYQELANKAGIHPAYLSRVVHSAQNCTFDVAGRLLFALGMRGVLTALKMDESAPPKAVKTSHTDLPSKLDYKTEATSHECRTDAFDAKSVAVFHAPASIRLTDESDVGGRHATVPAHRHSSWLRSVRYVSSGGAGDGRGESDLYNFGSPQADDESPLQRPRLLSNQGRDRQPPATSPVDLSTPMPS